MTDDPLAPGTMLADHLRIARRLGAGAAGVVYLAEDLRLDRTVAVKLLAVHASADAVARLAREAKAMARLAHPNVAAVHEIGQHHDRPWLAMEYVDGGTARAWLAAAPRSWREIVGLYVQAGRGLAAAHAAGVVHRDFKPDNVLVGSDGRVRVADFGLSHAPIASDVSTTHDVAASDAESLDTPSEITSELGLGTPAYMAPEQRAGHVDAAADQYALCVSIHEALFGTLPGRDRVDDAAVPSWLRAAIARGLAHDPRARWPSMAALVDRLERGLAGTRRRAIAAVGIVALAGTVAVTAAMWPRAPACDDAGARMQAIWSPDRTATLTAAFADVAGERGARAWSDAVGPIEAWTAEWIVERDASCAATRVDHVQREPVLERSMLCFDERAAELDALLDRLGELGADEVHTASDAVTRLPSVAACRSEPYLLANVAPPEDPTTLAAVEQLRAKLRTIEAIRRTDGLEEAIAAARPLRAEAEALGYDPVLAEVLQSLGKLVSGRGDKLEGRELLTLAHLVAHRCGAEAIAADVAARLADIAFAADDDEMGATWLALVQEDIARGVADPELAIDVERSLGHQARHKNDYDAAIAHYQRAEELAEELHSLRLHRGVVQEDIANVHYRAGRYDESANAHREAIAAFEHDYGPGTTKTALIHGNYGMVLRRLGRIDEAIAEQRIAIALLTDVHGPESPILGARLLALGVALVESGKIDEGRRELQRALAIAEAAGELGKSEVGSVLGALGWCEQKAGNYEAALAHEQRGLALIRASVGDDSIDAAKHRIQVGHTLTLLERNTEAQAEYRDALATFERIGQADHVGTAEAYGGLASVALTRGEIDDAVTNAERVIAIAARAKVMPDTLARARCDLADAKQRRGAPIAEAEALGKTAIAALREIGADDDADACAKRLATAR